MKCGVDKGPDNGAEPRLQFRIGDVNVAVQSDLPGLLDEVADLYPGAPDGPASYPTIQMEVRQTRSRLRGRRYQVYADGQEIGGEHQRDAVFPFLEWGINLRVIATRAQYVQLHAASLVHGDNGFILAGGSGSGKSTLAAGLMARGWAYLCDEFALIDRDTLRLESFPKPLCIKAGSFPVLKRLGLPFARRRDYIKSHKGRVGYINPSDVAGHLAPHAAPIRFVIFPKYAENRPPRLYPISRARALMDLAGCVFNRHAFDDQALSYLCRVIRRAECFQLEAGDLAETCDLLETQLCQAPALRQTADVPEARCAPGSSRGITKSAGSFPSRRDILRRSAKLAYVAPTVMTLTAQQAFAAASNPSGICSTAMQTGELCETDSDCCSSSCSLGICD